MYHLIFCKCLILISEPHLENTFSPLLELKEASVAFRSTVICRCLFFEERGGVVAKHSDSLFFTAGTRCMQCNLYCTQLKLMVAKRLNPAHCQWASPLALTKQRGYLNKVIEGRRTGVFIMIICLCVWIVFVHALVDRKKGRIAWISNLDPLPPFLTCIFHPATYLSTTIFLDERFW